MTIRIGRVPHASYVDTAAAARQDNGLALAPEHVATIAAAWQAPTGTGRTFAALASGLPVATGDLLDAIADAIGDATDPADVEILEALEAWVYRADPCDRWSGPCGDDGPCVAHADTISYAWDGSGTADELAASYLLTIAELGADVPADVLEIARRTSGWLEDSDDAQALSDAATYADGPDGTYTRWDGGWSLYRITGGPLQYS